MVRDGRDPINGRGYAREMNSLNGAYRAHQTRINAPEEVRHLEILLAAREADVDPDLTVVQSIQRKLSWWRRRLPTVAEYTWERPEAVPWWPCIRCPECGARQSEENAECACCGREILEMAP